MTGTAPAAWETPRLSIGGWVNDAACGDLSPAEADAFFFPARVNQHLPGEALRLCSSCPVAAQCAGYAAAHPVEGIWAGLSEVSRVRARGRLAS